MTTHTHLFRLLCILCVQLTEEKKRYNIYSYNNLSILHPCGAVFKQFNIIILVGFSLMASISFSCVHKQWRAIAPVDVNSCCLLPDGMCQFIHINNYLQYSTKLQLDKMYSVIFIYNTQYNQSW